MTGGNDLILTLVFLGLAIFVIMKLRSVLGTRTGFERPPEVIRREMEERQRPSGQNDNVVQLPTAGRAPQTGEQPEMTQAERWKGLAEAGTPVANGLDAIRAADPTFDARNFIGGARAAYEMIVLAYAKGDRKTLKDLLGKEVFDGFNQAIADREARGETSETTFVSIDRADFIGAEMRGKQAHVTVSFASKLITATRDKSGVVVDGSTEKIVDVNDIWTFARDVSTRDPNWRLVATESNG